MLKARTQTRPGAAKSDVTWGLWWGGNPGGGGDGQRMGGAASRKPRRRRRRRGYLLRSRLTVTAVLAWADVWKARTGCWPLRTSGPVPESPGDTWMAVSLALAKGHRGLPGGSSLAKL